MSPKIVAIALAAAVAAWAPSAATASNPTAVGAASPSSVPLGSSTLLTVAVSPGADPASTGVLVSCNLSGIGGSFSQLFADDGTGGDATPGDLVFSYRATVATSAALGPHSLSCFVSDAQGRSAVTSILVDVASVGTENAQPTAHANGPYAVDEGGSVTLSATGSDPEGGSLTYAWDLDGDGVYETPGQTVTYSPDDGPGTHTVSVRVTDPGGLSDRDSATVTVANVAPTATFGAPDAADLGAGFTLSLADPFDPSAADTAAGFTYAFDCGAGYGDFSAASTADCSSDTPGALAVGAKIRDKDGDATEYRSTVDVAATADGLCALTRSLTGKQQVADALCVKLARGHYRAYANQVAAQSGDEPGKAFDAATGDRLIALAAQLGG